MGELDSGAGGDTLGGDGRGDLYGRRESLEQQVLEGRADVFGEGHPALRERGLVDGILDRV